MNELNELLKEYQTLFYFVIYMVFMYYGLRGIGYQYDKMTNEKERLKDSFGNDIERLEKGKTLVKTNEEYNKRKREIIEDYHRSYTRINDDFKSRQLSLISQSIIIIGSLLIILVVVSLDF